MTGTQSTAAACPPPPCSDASAERGDSLAGTASQVAGFVLVEHPGGWGSDVITQTRFDERAIPDFLQRAERQGFKPLLMRRHVTAHTGAQPTVGTQKNRRQVFIASTNLSDPVLVQANLDDGSQLRDADPARIISRVRDHVQAAKNNKGSADNQPTSAPAPTVVHVDDIDWVTRTEPVFAVCVHGKHDVCCARKGRPVVAALAHSFSENTWQVSHIGGDRFAGNMLVLPGGWYYGRLETESADAVARAHFLGQVHLKNLRGRAGMLMPVQAAMMALMQELDETATTSLVFNGVEIAQVEGHTDYLTTWLHRAKRHTDGGDVAYTVRVRQTLSNPGHRLTCHSQVSSPIPQYEIHIEQPT